MGHNERILRQEIIALSVATEWEAARREWSCESVYFAEKGDDRECLCTKDHIVEICVLRNKHNDATAEVGNVCVQRFMDTDLTPVFDGLRRIRKDYQKGINVETGAMLRRRRLITEWEFKFSLDTWRRPWKSLSPKAQAVRLQINRRALTGVARAGAA